MFIVYSKEGCVNCVRAKALLTARGIEFEEKMAGVDYDIEDLRRLGVRQLPYVTYELREENKCRVVGGLEELKKELF